MKQPKPWGHELLLHDKERHPLPFKVETIKLLTFTNIDDRTSVHTHPNKVEMFYCVNGIVQIIVANKRTTLVANDPDQQPIVLPANTIHQLKALAPNSVLLEISTQDSPEETIRVSDPYDR